MKKLNTFEDVFKHIQIGAEDDCWPWLGSISRDGTPYFTVFGRKYVAYRIVKWLMEANWNINDERIAILHSCMDKDGRAIDDRLCCNPKHTRVGTHEDNALDMMLRGRAGLTKPVLSDIVMMLDEHKELTHGQIAQRIEFKHKISCKRQTVTDIANGRRRAVLQARIREENAAIEHSGDSNGNSES